jgi:hypothetical protein
VDRTAYLLLISQYWGFSLIELNVQLCSKGRCRGVKVWFLMFDSIVGVLHLFHCGEGLDWNKTLGLMAMLCDNP